EGLAVARASLWRGAFFAVARHEAKQSPIAAIEIASQTPLAMTPPKILAINANVAEYYYTGRGSLSEAERHLADLYDVSSLFVARALVEFAIEQLHERPR
ncbi:MAG: hypothetical protein CVU38_15020, partial [Chloroflexi bacterium HGW-Chloroflexi-1]